MCKTRKFLFVFLTFIMILFIPMVGFAEEDTLSSGTVMKRRSSVATSPQLNYDPSGGRGSYVYNTKLYPTRCYTYSRDLGTYEDIEAAIEGGLAAYIAYKTAAIPGMGSASATAFSYAANNISRNLNSKIFPGESVRFTVVKSYNPVDSAKLQHYYQCDATYYNARNEVISTARFWLTETEI